MKASHRLGVLVAVVGLLLGAVVSAVAYSGDVTLLNVSYDPTRGTLSGLDNVAFAKYWKGQDWQAGHHPAVARRIQQAGPRRD